MNETAEQLDHGSEQAAPDDSGWPVPTSEVMNAIRSWSPLDAWTPARTAPA